MRIKKALAALTMATMIGLNCALTPATFSAPFSMMAQAEEESVTIGDLTFTKYEDHAEVTYCSDDAAEVVIPAKVDGLPVTRIGECAFQCASLASVTIPDSVTSIGAGAFMACFSLTDIVIPSSVTSIGSALFCDCAFLTSVTLPDGLTSIGEETFQHCTSLTDVIIPDSVTSIGDYAFCGCTALTNATIPDGVTRIGDYAFADCTSLTDVIIPDSVTCIGDNAFGEQFYGTTPWLIAQRKMDPLVIVNGILIDGTACKEMVVIPDSVTSISNRAFARCYSLTAVIIPDSVTSIGEGAFSEFSEQAEIWGAPGTAAEAFARSNQKIFHSIDNPEVYSGILLKHRAQQEIIDYMKLHPVELHSVSYETEPDLNAPYAPGKLDSATEQSALNMLNIIRFIAGLDAVELSEEYSLKAQGASLLCAVSNKSSHSLGQPSDMPDELYAECFNGCQSSNLGEGYSSPADSILYGYMEDTNPPENIQSVGHRRWCLNPQMQKTGFGYVSNMTAMYALDRGHPEDAFGVCWPAENTPVELAPSVWSYSAGYDIDENADVQVTLTRENDGKQWHFSKAEADGEFYINNEDIGQPGCIIFRPDNVGGYQAGDVFTVSITGTKQSPSYTVHFFETGFPDMAAALKALLGDINGDGVVNASDAAKVLIAAAVIGAGKDPGLTDAQKKAADVNGDGTTNASDAAIILQYAAYIGAGNPEMTLAEYMLNKK
ncbi:MAG: leucine-rich repeat protein [Oscillospiraceae bacterium]|nr:leucine-rich repeat protein [Oscillospiraceae bacterium]